MSKILKKHCNHFGSALEIGCGNGKTSKWLSRHFKSVVGADLSNEQIEKNKRTYKQNNLQFISKNAFELDKKYDFIFASDMFMYTPNCDVKTMFEKLLALLNDDGVLLVRESTSTSPKGEWNKSKNYVAYYRNHKSYTKGIFKPYFAKKYRNYGYNAYHLGKYFSVFGEAQKVWLAKNPQKFKKIVKNFVNSHSRTSHFYAYKREL